MTCQSCIDREGVFTERWYLQKLPLLGPFQEQIAFSDDPWVPHVQAYTKSTNSAPVKPKSSGYIKQLFRRQLNVNGVSIAFNPIFHQFCTRNYSATSSS